MTITGDYPGHPGWKARSGPMGSKPKSEKATIATTRGTTTAECAWRGKAWGATKAPFSGEHNRWRITHLRTGRAVPCSNDWNEPWVSKRIAVRVAKALDEKVGEFAPRSRMRGLGRSMPAEVGKHIAAVRDSVTFGRPLTEGTHDAR